MLVLVVSLSTRESVTPGEEPVKMKFGLSTVRSWEHSRPRVRCPGVDFRRSQHNQCVFIPSLVTHLLDFHSVLGSIVKAVGATKMTQAQLPGIEGLVFSKTGLQGIHDNNTKRKMYSDPRVVPSAWVV